MTVKSGIRQIIDGVDKSNVEVISLTDLSDVTLTSLATDDFLKKSAGDWVNFGLFKTANTWTAAQKLATTTKLLFRDSGIFIHSNTDGEMTIQADGKVIIGVAGDTVLGDSTLRVMKPQTDEKIDLGTATARYRKGFFSEDVKVEGGIITKSVDDNVASPPTDAELDTAFGTPATVGDGFMGVVDDAGGGADVWLCVSDGTNWWYEALTKAV